MIVVTLPDGFSAKATIKKDWPLSHPSPDPISSSPLACGAAAPPKRRPGRPQKNASIEYSSSIRKGILVQTENLSQKVHSIAEEL
ncbi:Uncharacterised protein [uncultured archaeon]|nr:Uncharacterised protein [uncultured archaeon]